MRQNQVSKSSIKGQAIARKDVLSKRAFEAIPRDDLRSAYAGDQNKGPAKKSKSSLAGESSRGRRLNKNSGKTPVR